MSKRPVWELEQPGGTWVPFSAALKTQAEQAFRASLKTLLHGIPCVSNDLEGEGGAGYTFDWLRMTRVDAASGERRRIRRVAAPTAYLSASGARSLEHYAQVVDECGYAPVVIHSRPAAARRARDTDEDVADEQGQPAPRRVRLEAPRAPAAAAPAGAAPAALAALAAPAPVGAPGAVPLDAHAVAQVRGTLRTPPVHMRVLEEDTPRGRVIYHYEMRHKSRPQFVIRQMIKCTDASGETEYVYYSRFGALGTVGQLNSYGNGDKKLMLSQWRAKFKSKFGATWTDVAAVGDRVMFNHDTFDLLPLPVGGV